MKSTLNLEYSLVHLTQRFNLIDKVAFYVAKFRKTVKTSLKLLALVINI